MNESSSTVMVAGPKAASDPAPHNVSGSQPGLRGWSAGSGQKTAKLPVRLAVELAWAGAPVTSRRTPSTAAAATILRMVPPLRHPTGGSMG